MNLGQTSGAMRGDYAEQQMTMPGSNAKGLTYKQPAQMVVQQAENGWVVSVSSPVGQRHWVAKSENELAALMKQLAEDCAERQYEL